MSAPRKPDYILKAMDKESDDKHRVGAAWQEENGSLTIQLDRFVVLSGKDDALVLKLFPKDFKEPVI